MDPIDELKLLRAERPDRPGATPDGPDKVLRRAIADELGATSTKGIGRWAWVGTVGTAVCLTALVLAVVGGSESGVDGSQPQSVDEPPIIYGEGLLEFANDTAADVTSHADQVSLVTAVASTTLPVDGDPAQIEAGEGFVNREMTFRVDENVWVDDRLVAEEGEAFTALVNGYVLHEGELTRFAIEGTPWPEEGQQFLAPINASDEGKLDLELPAATFPFESSGVEPAPTQETPLAERLDGDSLPKAEDVLEASEERQEQGSVVQR